MQINSLLSAPFPTFLKHNEWRDGAPEVFAQLQIITVYPWQTITSWRRRSGRRSQGLWVRRVNTCCHFVTLTWIVATLGKQICLQVRWDDRRSSSENFPWLATLTAAQHSTHTGDHLISDGKLGLNSHRIKPCLPVICLCLAFHSAFVYALGYFDRLRRTLCHQLLSVAYYSTWLTEHKGRHWLAWMGVIN